jgi:hypothetical protein
MLNPILAEMGSKTHMKSVLAEAEQRRLARTVQAANKSRLPQRQRLPKRSALRRLVTSLRYTAP